MDDKRLEITNVVDSYKKKVEDERSHMQKVADRLKRYETSIEEFLWMVEDHIYEHNSNDDPVRKAHEMACSVLHLTPGELREMFRDCKTNYKINSPRILEQWLAEYRLIAQDSSDTFPQKFAQFLFRICFSDDTNQLLGRDTEKYEDC